MSPLRVAFATVLSSALALSAVEAVENLAGQSVGKTVTLPASAAKVTGNLQIQGEGEKATIHFWNRLEDSISWTWPDAKPGNYRVGLNYSLDRAGGKISLTVGDQQLVVPAEPTKGWMEYKTSELGVVSVTKAGETAVTLQAVQLPGGNGALPDVAWLSLTPADAPATSQPPKLGEFHGKPIFDGKTLEGWEGDLAWFRVEDGAIVAGTFKKPIPVNEFLATKKEYGDFELRLKFKMVNPKDANGGVQFRSQRIPNDSEMVGYQADIISWKWGALYDESRRAKFLGTPLNEATLKQIMKPDGWNDYAIRCEGPRVQFWVNSVPTLDYTEDDLSVFRNGHIALQIHSGPPSEVAYKDIELEELPQKIQ